MKQQNLIELSNKTGDVMLSGLQELENKYQSILKLQILNMSEANDDRI